ncbi:hypothetical protein AYO49_02160 [Verrucomicrobiaceae bacterium SCGC AG-212-N21]|nr:hypothetical protein AYO49_02160 [Verrucomicrobiaceae bacterium SCGC AG-212-N21]
MKQDNHYWHMEVADAIRANQLIRGRVDFGAFTSWYHSLTSEQQGCLVRTLCEYACQAGVDEAVYAEALQAAGLSGADPVVQHARRKQLFLDHHLTQFTEGDRFAVFTMFVYLFAVAEGRVFRAETKEHCNHWWHRDLLDDRVVQALLSDPTFYSTSMRDDDAIKQPAA